MSAIEISPKLQPVLLILAFLALAGGAGLLFLHSPTTFFSLEPFNIAALVLTLSIVGMIVLALVGKKASV